MSSPDNSTVPPLTEIVDVFGQVWTIGLANEILLNGIQASGGTGIIILYVNKKIYVFGTDNNWYLWDNNWTNVGQQRPGPIPVNLQAFWIRTDELQTYLTNHGNNIKFVMLSLRDNGMLIIIDMI